MDSQSIAFTETAMAATPFGAWSTAALVAATLLGTAALAEPSNKWRIEFDDKAQTDGKIVLSVTPADGSTVQAIADIPAGTHENHIARLVRDSLKTALGGGYNVEVDDGEDVLVKHDGAGNFDLKLVSSSVTGLEIELERE
jgi:hypothetical protein